jgi:hypothetical protein
MKLRDYPDHAGIESRPAKGSGIAAELTMSGEEGAALTKPAPVSVASS